VQLLPAALLYANTTSILQDLLSASAEGVLALPDTEKLRRGRQQSNLTKTRLWGLLWLVISVEIS
jgi:hypothetical protein